EEPAGRLARRHAVGRMRAEGRAGPVAQRLRRQIVFQKERLQAIHLATAPGDDHDRALGPQRFQVGEGLGEGTALDPDPDRLWMARLEAQDRRPAFGQVVAVSRWYGRDGDEAARSTGFKKMGEREEELFGRRQRRRGRLEPAV